MAKRKTKRATPAERTRARQTGASVAHLRREQRAAEKASGIEALVNAKARYEDSVSCGDAVPKALEVFRTEDGCHVDGLTTCLRDNGCKVPTVDMSKHGAVGRFRMVAGLMLRAAMRKTGTITVGETVLGEVRVPKRRQGKRSRNKRKAA